MFKHFSLTFAAISLNQYFEKINQFLAAIYCSI